MNEKTQKSLPKPVNSSRTFWDKLYLVVKGLFMGAANKVPGVSGGIVAFVGGFYEEFIYSLQKVNGKAFKLLFNGRFTSFYRYVNGQFLLLLITGMLISYFSVARLIDFFLQKNELYVWAAFFGMVLGSIYYIAKDYDHWHRKTITAGLAGMAVGLSISFLSPATENDNLVFIFFCGILSVSGMTLPGLSGSFILILLGNYVLLLVDSVNALYDSVAEMLGGDFGFVHDRERLRTLLVLGVFTAGSTVGLVTFSHLLGYVLKRFHNITTAVIIGFITGSLGVIWPWKRTIFKQDASGGPLLDTNGDRIIKNYARYWPEMETMEHWGAVFFIVLGFFLLLSLDWYGKNREAQEKIRTGR